MMNIYIYFLKPSNRVRLSNINLQTNKQLLIKYIRRGSTIDQLLEWYDYHYSSVQSSTFFYKKN